jgi:hypothetical protein
MTDKDRIAALEREVAALKAQHAPPAPAVTDDWSPINPIDRLAMPVSTMREMARAVPDSEVRQIAMRDNRAPTGPSSAGAIPSSQLVSNVRGANVGGGWAREIPLSNPPGTRLIDTIAIADEVRQRSEKK